MGVRVLYDNNANVAVLYCSTSDIAFGPLFFDEDGHDARDRVELFLEWLPLDARKYSDSELLEKYSEWKEQEVRQRRSKEEEDEN